MGKLTVVITGAGGFLGRACVAEARRRELPVLALYRSTLPADWAGDAGITPLQLDLTAPDAADRLRAALPGDCAIIHAAAHLGGDPAAVARDTLSATRTLREVWRDSAARLVLISSLAVYDTDALSPGEALSEASPLIPLPDAPEQARDAYAGSKRLQEALFLSDAGFEDGWILRPGALWGPGRTWHGMQGFWASKLFVTIGSHGELPLAHVDLCAEIAVEAAHAPTSGPGIVNVFDDDRPTRARFLRAHRRCFGWPRLNVTVPYRAWLALARLLKPVSGHLPGLFRESILRARLMPLRYPNTRMRSAFPGEDVDTFEGLMARAAEDRA
ncbi:MULTISPECIES: NAD(P)-dependent oxidoreductase [unclassified Mameliella]|uniref:NAD-dependent epimerase/dehydratase family protein n=1 Tax=unclassified Mameliella TaxID=2630630 RepID=UPI00273E4F6C|nr:MULTISPECIES: NAD-dependent epimerase/dehydratase family protein [unclassified Mameliella]